MIRLLIVDDEIILRESLKLILELDIEIQVLDCAGNGYDALDICRRNKPDIVLMDIVMPVCDGVEGTRIIKAEFPDIKIIILTTFQDMEHARNALSYGADSYILKLVKPDELVSIIKNTHQNLSIIHSASLKSFLNDLDVIHQKNGSKVSFHFTETETDIIRLITDGKSNREISSELFISDGTVKNTITHLLEKLELRDRTQLAVFAVRNNIV